MDQILVNNATTTISGAITASDTNITIVANANFVNPGSDYYLATLWSVDSTTGLENAWEIVKVTAKTGDVLTVQRGQENTTARAWDDATPIQMRITADTVRTTLSSLSDVNVGDIFNGQVLSYNSELSAWSNTTPSSGSVTLSGLSDVDVGDIFDGQVLAYDAELNVWSNIDSPSGSTTFSGLSDTDFVELSNNDIAVYDVEFGAWVNRSYITTLQGLTDVGFAELQDGELLGYSNANGWTNVPAPTLDSVLAGGSSTSSTLTVGALNIGAWTIQLDGSDLRFIYNGVDVFRITTTGAVIAKDDVTAFGAP